MEINEILRKAKAEGGKRVANVENIDAGNRTVSLAFSSESAQVSRWFGTEILGHKAGEVRLDRINDGGPLLMDHDWTDQIGVVENARIDGDGVGRATVRFGKSPRADEIFRDVQDGIRRHVSVGYAVRGMQLISDDEENGPVYRVTDWEPTEISMVSVPADHGVGIGRGLSHPDIKPPEGIVDNQGKNTGTPSQYNGENRMSAGAANEGQKPNPDTTALGAQPTRDYESEKRAAMRAEQERVKNILDLGRQYGASDLAAEFAANPQGTVEGLSRALLERTGKTFAVPAPSTDIGMTKRDLRNFSVLRAVRAMTAQDRRTREAAGFEFEVSQEAAKRQNQRNADGIIIPSDVLRHNLSDDFSLLRDGSGTMNTASNGQTGAGSTGGATVQTSVLAGSYIDILRNKAVFARGARMLGGLVGNISIPRQTAATQGYWLGEGDDATFSAMDFGAVELKPKTAAANTVITRRLLEQSSMDVEMLVRADLAKQMALVIDYSGYYGHGGDKQPLGLANMLGIGGVTFAGPQPTWQELVELETMIAEKNADVDSMRFKARPAFRGYAKTALKFNVNGSQIIWEDGGTVNGYPVDVTNQVATGDLFFGNFGDVLMGMWGGLELIVDPYTRSTAGNVVLTTFQDIDWQFRRTESFVYAKGGAPAASSGSTGKSGS
ncbi:phage major capsid protein [Bombella pollinis]|uniref:Phage major capsid protein n=1 Tax=Bombella pollinis TaxID=2967337 RepID=A0ABT3WLE2_9PROT|nr:phage major capsid protein [Bombella pollinis]MCX5619914.1 phage major capsid protein [Bombella pollinis]